jgi:hypothetical protein
VGILPTPHFKKHNMKKNTITIIIILLALFGEIRCFYKTISCNWNPIGKAEIIYTASTFTGLGVIVGYINIEDK